MFLDYLISNFALLCICIAMVFIIIYNARGQTRENQYCFLIVVSAFILSIIVMFEQHYKKQTDNVFLPTLFSYLGYIIRPVVVYFFIQLVGKKIEKQWLFYIPLALNALIYTFALFVNVEPLRKLVFYYVLSEDGTEFVFTRGYLNFTAHIIAGLYTVYFLVNVFKKLNSKHKNDCIVLFVCSLFVVGAVILESLHLALNVLNVTIAISCFFYYLYLYVQQSRLDALTGCLDRKSFYHDSKKFSKNINGVINIDMNGLKAINDNQGHHEGDKAILFISKVIEDSTGKNSYVYRLGGDEFTVILVDGKQEDIDVIIRNIRRILSASSYTVSIGYAYSEKKDMTIDELSKIADEKMYLDKEEFYKNSKMERRKSPRN